MSMGNNGPGSEALSRLIPERLLYLFSERPLLWCEDAGEYDALLAEIFAEMDPKGVIETLLVKDLVDYLWEIRRLRALKVAAFHAELPSAAGRMLERSYNNPMMRNFHAEQVKGLVFAAAAGLPVQAQSLERQMSEAHVTAAMMQYEALKVGLNVMTAIETSLVRLERRRDQILKQISERRQAFKAMARDLIDRDEAQLIEANVGKSH